MASSSESSPPPQNPHLFHPPQFPQPVMTQLLLPYLLPPVYLLQHLLLLVRKCGREQDYEKALNDYYTLKEAYDKLWNKKKMKIMRMDISLVKKKKYVFINLKENVLIAEKMVGHYLPIQMVFLR